MPELPEVETVVRDLRPLLVGRTITNIETSRLALRRRWPANASRSLIDRTVISVDRRGKWIVIELDEPALLVHLGMTGQFTVAPADVPRQDHTHFIFRLDNTQELRFRDIRRFGSVSLYSGLAELRESFIASKLGPEPFDVDPKMWHASLKKTNRNLKACLLDQRLIAGVGNIYADEALFEAKLNPKTLGSKLTRPQAERLRLAVEKVLRRGIELRGSTIRNYVGGSGLQGAMQNEFQAYGRTGEPCSRCSQPIERIVLAGRSTHFCPRCQR
ncbi:MAG: bifunctional DNA-formamidopyrimidine glycosylase/DNA-(apurinic or apyrimidinic site) lyase [Planctomycetota bacterium]